MKIIEHTQGSAEWLNWRKSGVGGSDAPAVLGESPYSTPLKLWRQKLDIPDPEKEDDSGKAKLFLKGHAIEEKIRQDYLEDTGILMEPVCVQNPKHPHIIASLDGFSEVKGILEAKYVGKDAVKRAMLGEIPRHHIIQMQHQFLASGIPEGIYYCHSGSTGVEIQVSQDIEFAKTLEEQLHKFWALVVNKIEPGLSDKDYLVPDLLTDPNAHLFAHIKKLKEQKEAVEAEYEHIKEQIIKLYGHPKLSCSGVKIYRSERPGNMSYAKIPELKSLDETYLSQFRGAPVTSWTVKVQKQQEEASNE